MLIESLVHKTCHPGRETILFGPKLSEACLRAALKITYLNSMLQRHIVVFIK
jgi:hypothetical protein